MLNARRGRGSRRNLILSSPDNEVERLGTKFVSAETIKEIFDRYTQPEYKAIRARAGYQARAGGVS
jgi:hypothetical protein